MAAGHSSVDTTSDSFRYEKETKRHVVLTVKQMISDVKDAIKELKLLSCDKVNVLKLLSEKIDKWKDTEIIVAIIGNTGVGKSTFINSYCGLKRGNPNVAETGATHTTKSATVFSSNDNPNVKLVDLPGLGASGFEKKDYLQKIEFDRFDIFLLINAGRFTENDAWLAGEMKKRNKAFFLVRTKVWNDVENENKNEDVKIPAKIIIEDIRKECAENLKENVDKIYLIDSKEPANNLLDYSKLKADMVTCLGRDKREALLHALRTGSEELIHMHATVLRSKIKWSAFKSALGNCVPVPGAVAVINSLIFSDLKNLFLERLDINGNESYRSKLKSIGISDAAMKRILDIIGICREECESKAREEHSKQSNTAYVLIRILEKIPLLGSPAAFAGTYLAANNMLDRVVKDSLTINKIILEEVHKQLH